MVNRDSPEVEDRFVISFPPNFVAHLSFGLSFERATRPMLACDIETREIIFLKDSHRADVDEIKKEGDTYSLLESHSVPNIPPVVKGNDFHNYTSLTNTPGDIILLRMSLGVATRQLTTFKSSQAFVNAVAGATEGKVIFADSDHMTNCFVCAAHQQAYFGAHILHCDASVNNILITDEGKGLLVDWDLSLHLNNGDKPLSARQLGRTGTWRFMSAAFLLDDKKCYELEDARESFLHILTWMALRFTDYTTSGCTRDILRTFRNAYDTTESTEGAYVKKGILLFHDVSRVVKFDHRPQLDALIEELTRTFAVRYENPPPPMNLQAPRDACIPESIITQLPAFSYQKRLDDLVAPNWLVDIFRRYLSAG